MTHFYIFLECLHSLVCACACMCVIASGPGSEGYKVWISWSIGGMREREREGWFAVSTETLLSGEMQTCRATGSQGGYQADGWTAGSDLVEQRGFPIRGRVCGFSLTASPAPLTHTKARTRTNKHILGDTNNSWHIEI